MRGSCPTTAPVARRDGIPHIQCGIFAQTVLAASRLRNSLGGIRADTHAFQYFSDGIRAGTHAPNLKQLLFVRKALEAEAPFRANCNCFFGTGFTQAYPR